MVYRYVVNLSFPGGGGPGVNVWHLRAPTEAGPIQSAIDAIGAFYGNVRSIMATGTVVTGPPEAIAGIEGTAPTFEPVTGFTVTSNAANSSLAPPATQLVVSWRTTAATRSGMGRTFVGPLSSGALDTNGTPTTQALSIATAAADAIMAHNETLNSAAIGVWSPTDGVIRDITSYRVRDRFAVLRSRRPS